MVGKGAPQLVEAARGELREGAPAITRASDARQQPIGLQPVDAPGEPARGQVGPLGELVHAELVAGLIRERQEHREGIRGEHRAGPPSASSATASAAWAGCKRLPEPDRDRDRGGAGSGAGCRFDAGTQVDVHCT